MGQTLREPVTVVDRSRDALVARIVRPECESDPLLTKLDLVGKGGRVIDRSAAGIVNPIGANVGAGQVSPHGIRHTAVTVAALDEFNGNTRAGQRFGRHADARRPNAYDDKSHRYG